MIFDKFVAKIHFRRAIAVAHDLIVAACAFIFAYVTVLGLERTLTLPGVVEKTASFVLASAICFIIFATHRGSWRYVSVLDLVTIIKASFCAVVIYTVGAFLVSRGSNVPRSVPVLSMLYLIAGLAAPRLAYRLHLEHSLNPMTTIKRRSQNTRYVLLYGLNSAADTFIRSTRRDSERDVTVAGVVDDGRTPESMIQGVRVLGSMSHFEQIVAKLSRQGIQVTELIVTVPDIHREVLGTIVERATRLGIVASRLPLSTETAVITKNGLIASKPIELADLLGRPEIKTDLKSVAAMITGKTVLATGAAGSIGSELCRQIVALGPRALVITDSSEFHLYLLDMELRNQHPNARIITRIADVRDSSRISKLFKELCPDLVFHAAALKHVPMMELNPLEAIKTNLFGTRNVANAASEAGVSTVLMISTDKAVNPTSIMGATKRAAETYCQALDVSSGDTRFQTVRFGNVLGSNGSVVPRFQKQIARGGPITVTHPDIVRFFMTIPEAVRLVLHATARGSTEEAERGKIMILDMGEPVRIVDLAERMIQLAGYRPHIDIKIDFTGLRPGEKLYEELLAPSEASHKHTEAGFIVASSSITDKTFLNRILTSMETAVLNEDKDRAVELLSSIVNDYQPQNKTAMIEPDTDAMSG